MKYVDSLFEESPVFFPPYFNLKVNLPGFSPLQDKQNSHGSEV